MAWNPSPEVQVARDAAAELGRILGRRIDRVVILFTDTADQCGFVSYGETAAKCREAKAIGDLSYKAAFEEAKP